MARRATAERGTRHAPGRTASEGDVTYDTAMTEGYGGDAMGDRGGRGRSRWSGSGGRWWIWVGRAILWAFIIVVVVNGIRAPFERFTQPETRPTTGASPKSAFPETQASAYALQFASAYLNYDQKNPAARATKLAPYLPENADQQLGWNGSGSMTLSSAQVAGVDVRDKHNAVVTLAVSVNGTWMQLAVPVYTSGGTMAIKGQPALMPTPGKATVPESASITEDSAVETQLKTDLKGFFVAYAASDAAGLDRFLAPNVSLNGLNGAVRLSGIKDVVVPEGGDRRHATVTVAWQVPSTARKAAAGELDQTYDLTIVHDQDKWNVEQLRGSTETTGP